MAKIGGRRETEETAVKTRREGDSAATVLRQVQIAIKATTEALSLTMQASGSEAIRVRVRVTMQASGSEAISNWLR